MEETRTCSLFYPAGGPTGWPPQFAARQRGSSLWWPWCGATHNISLLRKACQGNQRRLSGFRRAARLRDPRFGEILLPTIRGFAFRDALNRKVDAEISRRTWGIGVRRGPPVFFTRKWVERAPLKSVFGHFLGGKRPGKIGNFPSAGVITDRQTIARALRISAADGGNSSLEFRPPPLVGAWKPPPPRYEPDLLLCFFGRPLNQPSSPRRASHGRF